jgi:hypothetical protein
LRGANVSFEEYMRNWYKRAVVSLSVRIIRERRLGRVWQACAELQVLCNGGRKHHGKNRLKDGRLRKRSDYFPIQH